MPINKHFKLIFFSLLFFAFLLKADVSFAVREEWRAPEIQYPSIPFSGVETPNQFIEKIRNEAPGYTPDRALPLYIKYFYSFALLISGLIAFVSVIIGGFKYLVSAGNPGKIGDAKDQITAGFLGLIILFFSYSMLTIINPALTIFNVSKTDVALVFHNECNLGRCVPKLGPGANACSQNNDCPQATKEVTFIEIPRGRLTERLMLRSHEGREAAKKVEAASERLQGLARQLEALTKQCTCSRPCPNSIGMPPDCTAGGENCSAYSNFDTCCTLSVTQQNFPAGTFDINYLDCGCNYDSPCAATQCIEGAVATSSPPIPGPSPVGGSKLGIQTSFLNADAWRFISEASPRIVKLLKDFGKATDIKAVSPGTFVVGRFCNGGGCENGPGGIIPDIADKAARAADAKARALWFFNKYRWEMEAAPDVDCWEGENEVGVFNDRQMDWWSEAESERVKLLASIGRKACIGTFGEGNPGDMDLWPYFYPAIGTAIDYGGYLDLHEYAIRGERDEWHIGRYRKVYDNYLKPAGLDIPLIISETGVDEKGDPLTSGWRAWLGGDVNAYMDLLIWYDNMLKEDDYVIGATIFHMGLFDWSSFELAPEMTDPLIDYVSTGAAVPGPVVVKPRPKPQPAPGDPCPNRLQIVAKQNEILRFLDYYNILRQDLLVKRSLLAIELFKFKLAEVLMRDSSPGPLAYQNFHSTEEYLISKGINVIIQKLKQWEDIDIKTDPLVEGVREVIAPGLPGENGTDDPATFFVQKEGNESLIFTLETLSGEALIGPSPPLPELPLPPPVPAPPPPPPPPGEPPLPVPGFPGLVILSPAFPAEQLYQWDPRWGSVLIDSCSDTLTVGGCGLVSMTMIMQYFGVPSSFTPAEYAKAMAANDYICTEWGGSKHPNLEDLGVKLANSYGVNIGYAYFPWEANVWDDMKAQLAAGRPVLPVGCTMRLASGSYTGHIDVVKGIDDTYVWVQDPNDGWWHTNSKGESYRDGNTRYSKTEFSTFGCAGFYAFYKK